MGRGARGGQLPSSLLESQASNLSESGVLSPRPYLVT
jgi:hypothetical protein